MRPPRQRRRRFPPSPPIYPMIPARREPLVWVITIAVFAGLAYIGWMWGVQ